MSGTFAERVDAQLRLYRDEILPRFLDAYYRGGGYRLVAEMMDAHDARSIRDVLTRPAPSARARRMAAGALRRCPVVIAAATLGELQSLAPTVRLGLFTRRTQYVTGELPLSYRELGTDHVVQLFEAGFICAFPDAEWDDQILLTIFHELIHYFESHLPRHEQPLRGEEERDPRVRRYTVAAAIARDRRHARWRAIKWSTGSLSTLALVLAIAGARVTYDDAAALSALEHHLAGVRTERDRLAALEGRRPALEARRRELGARLAGLRQRDASYDPAALEQILRGIVGEHEVLAIGDSVVVSGSERSAGPSAAGALGAIARRAPALTVRGGLVGRGRWSLSLGLPGGVVEQTPRALPPLPGTMRVPTIERARGQALRAAITTAREEAERLTARTAGLADIEARAAALERAPAGGPRVADVARLLGVLGSRVSPALAEGELRFDGSVAIVRLAGPRVSPPALDLEALVDQPPPLGPLDGWLVAGVKRTTDPRGRSALLAAFVPAP